MRYPFYFLLMSLTSLLFSCNDQRIYEQNIDVEESNWNKKDTLTFEFEIPDSALSYNLYYNVRYTSTYPFYNLFTKYFIQDSSGRTLKSPEVPEDMFLFDVKTGQPHGTGLGDIFDQRISFLKNYKFPTKGKYKIKVVQYMRNEPLPGIVSFGIGIEKAENKAL